MTSSLVSRTVHGFSWRFFSFMVSIISMLTQYLVSHYLQQVSFTFIFRSKQCRRREAPRAGLWCTEFYSFNSIFNSPLSNFVINGFYQFLFIILVSTQVSSVPLVYLPLTFWSIVSFHIKYKLTPLITCSIPLGTLNEI